MTTRCYLNFLRYLPRSQWADTSLVEFMRQVTHTADPDELVEDTLQRMQESSVSVFPVVDPTTG